MSTWRSSEPSAVALVAGFYVALIGAKAAVAVLVAGGRAWLTPKAYRVITRVAAVGLIAVGVALVVEFAPDVAEALSGAKTGDHVLGDREG